MVSKVKDRTECHVVEIRTGTGYSMVNASGIHFIKFNNLNYERQRELKT